MTRPPRDRSQAGARRRSAAAGATGAVAGDNLFPWRDTTFLLEAAVLLAVAVLCYAQVLHRGAGFVWDDVALVDNRLVHAPDGLASIWFDPGQNSHEEHYWPLVYTTFWIEHKLWGLWAPGYHAVNVALHALNCLLIWVLLRRIGLLGAWAAALIFAAHPVHAESVAWIIERKDVLSGLFYLLAFHLHWSHVETEKRRYQVAAVAAFAAGLLSKSIVISLPIALLIVLWWKRGEIRRGDVLALVPMVLVGVLLTLLDLAHSSTYFDRAASMPLLERVLLAPEAFWFYLTRLVLPVNLMAIYPKWPIVSAGGWVALAGVAALLAMLWSARHKIGRGPLAAVLFYGATLGPILGLVSFGFQQYSYVADRYQYLASLGPIALAAAAGAYWFRGRPELVWGGRVVAAVIVAALAVGTFRYAYTFGNAEALWTRTLQLNPEAWEAKQQLGRLLADRGVAEQKPELAEKGVALLLASIEQNPKYYQAHYNLGTAYHSMGRGELAEKHFRRTLELRPDFILANNGLGAVLAEQGRFAEAIPHFERTLEFDPDNADAQMNLKMAREEMAGAPAPKR